VVTAVAHLFCKHEALSSNPGTLKKKERKESSRTEKVSIIFLDF
jgi:hypothetical protein